MFNFKKSLDGSVMQLVKMPAAAGDYKVGEALTYSGGKLAAASGNAVVQYICADNAKLEAAGDIIVSPVTSDMIFNAKLTAFSAGTVVAGERLQISADGMGVTATAATESSKAGAFIVDTCGAAAVGDTIEVRLDYYN